MWSPADLEASHVWINGRNRESQGFGLRIWIRTAEKACLATMDVGDWRRFGWREAREKAQLGV